MNLLFKNNWYLRLILLSIISFQLSISPVGAQNWRDSLTVLNKLIDTQPWSTDVHLRKAAANLQLKQWQYAVDEYGLILQKEPHNPAALFYRAYANTHLRHFDLAKNDLNDLLIVVPSHFEARLSLAIVLQQLGRKQEALDQLNQTIQMHADSAVAYAARANVERQMKTGRGRTLRLGEGRAAGSLRPDLCGVARRFAVGIGAQEGGPQGAGRCRQARHSSWHVAGVV